MLFALKDGYVRYYYLGVKRRNIEIELISPTVDKQREGFGEYYLAISNGRMKIPL
jgi:hypothetical protein